MLVNYLNQEFDPRSQSNTDEQLRVFEARHGISLPMQYRQFLLNTNGGVPNNKYSESPDRRKAPFTKAALINSFLGFDSGGHYDLDSWICAYAGRLPEYFIPIAGDQGGNVVCLATAGKFEGQVFFWDHEDEYNVGFPEEGDASDYYDNVYLLGTGFNEFFEKLQDERALASDAPVTNGGGGDYYAGLLRNHQRMLSKAEAESDEQRIAMYTLLVSDDYLGLGNFDEAEKYFHRGMNLFTELGRPPKPEVIRWDVYLDSLNKAREEQTQGDPDWHDRHVARTTQ